jgi:diacylglycerol kinase (ATP)
VTKYKIILNPISNQGKGIRLLPEIEQTLKDLGLEFSTVVTECPGHAIELAQNAAAEGYDVVVAVGGDGTANEVLNGLMLAKQKGVRRVAMGVLATGRGNDFAYGVGVPKDWKVGCQALADDKRRVIDVGRVTGGLFPEGRFFGNGVGIGFDAVVGFEAAKMTHLHGFPSYVAGALKTIFLFFKAPLVNIELDDHSIEARTLLISVMNGKRMGGTFMMAPSSVPEDGKFDLCIARQVSRPAIFGLIFRFMKGTQFGHPAITNSRTSRITVTAREGTLPAHADGETLCIDGQQLSMEILPQQLELVYSPAAIP